MQGHGCSNIRVWMSIIDEKEEKQTLQQILELIQPYDNEGKVVIDNMQS